MATEWRSGLPSSAPSPGRCLDRSTSSRAWEFSSIPTRTTDTEPFSLMLLLCLVCGESGCGNLQSAADFGQVTETPHTITIMITRTPRLRVVDALYVNCRFEVSGMANTPKARGIRNAQIPTKAKLTYFQDNYLQLELQYKKEDQWVQCFNVANVTLPSVAYLGFSAHCGDLSGMIFLQRTYRPLLISYI